MRTKRDELANWVRDYLEPRHPELVQSLLQAVDAFDRLHSGNPSKPDDLTTLVAAAHSPRTPLGENAAGMLGQLAPSIPAARQAILAMGRSRQRQVRINALVALEGFEAGDTHEQVARELLRDRSAQVRRLAADKMRAWRLRALIPDLQAAIDAEKNVALKATLEWQRDLLRDGYRIEHHPTKRLQITFQKAGGGVVSTSVSEAEWRTKGLAGVAGGFGIDPATLAAEPRLNQN